MTHGILIDALNEAAEDDELFGTGGACPSLFEPGHPESRVLLISGENAGGKSLFCRFLQTVIQHDHEKFEFMRVGMEMRSQGGIRRALMFGNESDESTGQISIRCVRGGISTCQGRENPHILCLDEPDIGLSEGYQAGLGELIANFACDLPKLTEGLVIVTHSRPIARALLSTLDHSPHCIRVGDDLRTTAEWIDKGPLPRTVDDVESLNGRSVERFRAVNKVIQQRRAERAAEKAKSPSR